MTKHRRFACRLTAATLLALSSAWAAEPTVTPVVPPADATPPESSLTDYQALSASQSRDYDRTQDISPQQMLLLLEVCERTGASLGQMLATGEHESARTWNDHVRPTLNNGSLGSASGVWQFMPATFHRIVKRFGTQLLAATEVDPASGREHLDLGEGPFNDAQVRGLIQETVDGKRGADDAELKLLRHNFAVLAFAKHYLSVDSGARTPEEDYLYHFLGAEQGRRVLALAQGEARDTLSVKPVETPLPVAAAPPALAVADVRASIRATAATISRDEILMPAERRLSPVVRQRAPSRVSVQWAPVTASQKSAFDYMISSLKPNAAVLERPADRARVPAPPVGSAIWSPPTPAIPPPVSSEWGFAADSPVVTGNLGMFYRDGQSQTQPYTWGEFMENLARRVRAKDQPAMVRAKYGVGFGLTGGDLPQRAFNPAIESKAATFRHEISGEVLVPEALVTGPLGPDETRWYKNRLAALIQQGEDQPLETLPPETLAALRHLTMLSSDLSDASTAHPEVSKALHAFRRLVGKDQPDDPAHLNRLMPAERIALAIYDQRLARYAALQAAQQASMSDAPDLSRIKTMPVGLQKAAAPHVSVLQTALAERGLLKQPTEKIVWRDRQRKKHVTYKTVPFVGVVGKATQAAIRSFQWRHGLRDTQGVLDAVTLGMLGLTPMGPEIFRPLSGPECGIDEASVTTPACEIPSSNRRVQPVDVILPDARLARRWEWASGPAANESARDQEPPSP